MKGNPVLAVLELRLTNRKGIRIDEIKIASAYGKNNAQSLINRSDILYVEPNKNKTDSWLKSNRLQLPLDITNYGLIEMIPQNDTSVNTNSTQKPKNYAQNSAEKIGNTEQGKFSAVSKADSDTYDGKNSDIRKKQAKTA